MEDDGETTLKQARNQTRSLIAEKLLELQNQVALLFGPNFAQEVTSALINRIMIMHEGVRVLNPTLPSDQYFLMRNTTYHSNTNKSIFEDDFGHAANAYLMRRCRRIFLQMHHI